MARQIPYFVDTSVLIAHLRMKPGSLRSPLTLATVEFGTPFVSEMVMFELEVGARRAGRTFEFHMNFTTIRGFPLSFSVLMIAAQIQADLLQQNQTIGLPDTFIAATAINQNFPLFTLNRTHFQRVEGLTLLDLP